MGVTNGVAAADILRWYARYGWTDNLEGEWAELQNNIRGSYRAALDQGETALDDYLSRMFRTDAITGLVSYSLPKLLAAPDETIYTELLRDCANNAHLWMHSLIRPDRHVQDMFAEALAKLTVPDVGAPVVWTIEDGDGGESSVMFDTFRHDKYARQISALALRHGSVVVEIGGGYGGTAHQLLVHRPDVQVVLVDIPDTLYLAAYWLSRVGHSVRWYDEEVETLADVVLLPAQDIEEWDDYMFGADLVFAAHSLTEIPLDVVNRYKPWIEGLDPEYIYYDAATYCLTTKNPDGTDRTAMLYPETLLADLWPSPKYRLLFSAPNDWRGSGTRYCDVIYGRNT